MSQRGPARDAFHLTPLLLTTVIAALLSSALVAVLWSANANRVPGPPPPVGGPPGPPPTTQAALTIAVAVFTIAWVAVIVAACRDQILRRIEAMVDRIGAVTVEYGVQRDNEGVLYGMRLAETNRAPAGSSGSTGPAGPTGASAGPGGRGPASDPGGHVVPFPRQTPPGEHQD